ncbi:hypothetical protein [Aestuariivivens sediminis]|uniref:hypothetical protein n=1 Tax=Aestuariivivens sediminis TaxID=2913557 RepID=UPI001F563C76|nr:hypothetical protein [Aestuariivivens sediminis]
MTFDKNTANLISAFKKLSLEPLEELCDVSIYSYDYKQELIEKLQKKFDKISSEDISELVAKESKCKYCYHESKAYSFHHPKTDELIVRYVIFRESENFYRVEECKYKPILNREDGFPF